MKVETPIMDLTPKLFATVKTCQSILAKWILPDSKMTDEQALDQLLEILDDKELVEKMNEILK